MVKHLAPVQMFGGRKDTRVARPQDRDFRAEVEKANDEAETVTTDEGEGTSQPPEPEVTGAKD